MNIIILLFVFIFFQTLGYGIFSIVAVLIFSYFLIDFIEKLNDYIAFKEFILVLFSLNYLMSPALMFNGLQKYQYYDMGGLTEKEYFEMAIPCILLLYTGLKFTTITRIFNPDLENLRLNATLMIPHMKVWVFLGIFLRFICLSLPTEIKFVVSLLSLIRFAAAYGFFIIDPKKFKYYILAVFINDYIISLGAGLFHDALLWTMFLILIACYIYKPAFNLKLIVIALGIILVYFIQLAKGTYRAQLAQDKSGLLVFVNSIQESKSDNEGGFFDIHKLAESITRVNQGWIFANTVSNMNKTQDFQGFSLLVTYAEAALLPRALDANKLSAGDKALFTRFSGKTIDKGTSMGLGILADGYISFGVWGAYIFAFALGALFSFIFNIVDRWSQVSPFFVVLIFGILDYAVRPDCETQTMLGFVVKCLFIYELFVRFYAWYLKNNFGFLSLLIR